MVDQSTHVIAWVFLMDLEIHQAQHMGERAPE